MKFLASCLSLCVILAAAQEAAVVTPAPSNPAPETEWKREAEKAIAAQRESEKAALELENTTQKLRQEMAALQLKLDQTKDEATTYWKDLEATRGELKEEKSKAHDSSSQLQAKFDELKKQHGEGSSQNAALIQEKQALESRINSLGNEKSSLQTEHDRTNRLMVEANERLEAFKKESSEALSASDREKRQLTAELLEAKRSQYVFSETQAIKVGQAMKKTIKVAFPFFFSRAMSRIPPPVKDNLILVSNQAWTQAAKLLADIWVKLRPMTEKMTALYQEKASTHVNKVFAVLRDVYTRSSDLSLKHSTRALDLLDKRLVAPLIDEKTEEMNDLIATTNQRDRRAFACILMSILSGSSILVVYLAKLLLHVTWCLITRIICVTSCGLLCKRRTRKASNKGHKSDTRHFKPASTADSDPPSTNPDGSRKGGRSKKT